MNRRNLVTGGVVAIGVLLLLIIINLGNIWNWIVGAIELFFDPEGRIDPQQIVMCSEAPGCGLLHPIIFGIILIFAILTGFAYTTLLERKLLGWMQHRTGPNRVGPAGLLQPLADAIKLIFKEDIVPDRVDRPVYFLAPIMKAVPVIILMAVIPLGPDILIPWFDGNIYQIPLGIADVNVGVLYILGITSIGTYGMVLAGWASNNKYAMLGGLRASAQMISYELSLGLVIAVPVMLVGSMSVGDIIDAQGADIFSWFVFQNPLAAGILVLALFAEVARAPFDIPEAEQELTAGYMTEYSGMKFAIFMMAEYIGMIVVSVIAVSMFFGGYHFIFVDSFPLLGPLFLIGKVVVFLSLFIWVRATLPRLRYDRLMALGWKVLLPLSLVAVAWTAIAAVIGDATQSSFVYGLVSGIFFVVVVGAGYLFLRAEGEEVEVERDLADDPIVTGERRGLGWAALTLLGGLVAIPFMLIRGLIVVLEGLGNLDRPINSEETAIEPVDSSAPSTSGGD